MPTVQDAPRWNVDDSYGEKETVPALIPADAEAVVSVNAWLRELHLVNNSDQAVTVTLMDRQETPRPIVPAVEIKPHSDHLRIFTSRFCPGGITWQASAANAVTGYARWRR